MRLTSPASSDGVQDRRSSTSTPSYSFVMCTGRNLRVLTSKTVHKHIVVEILHSAD